MGEALLKISLRFSLVSHHFFIPLKLTPTIITIRPATLPAAIPIITPVLSFDFDLRDALTVVSVRVVVVDAVVVVVMPGQ